MIHKMHFLLIILNTHARTRARKCATHIFAYTENKISIFLYTIYFKKYVSALNNPILPINLNLTKIMNKLY